MLRFQVGALVVVIASAVLGGRAEAESVGFQCLTFNSPSDCATGEAQLAVEVADPGDGRVLFTFTNAGAAPSSITGVYFDDGTLLAIAEIVQGTGVSFSQGATPPDLPGGNSASPPFNVTAGFLADSDPPVQPNGVNPGETLMIYFSLQPGQDYSSVLADLASGALRIGLHVQGFASGGSESFVNVPVPLPAAGLLFLSGLLGLVGAATRNHRSALA